MCCMNHKKKVEIILDKLYIMMYYTTCMREWLSGGAPPCQGGGRGFDPRLAL